MSLASRALAAALIAGLLAGCGGAASNGSALPRMPANALSPRLQPSMPIPFGERVAPDGQIAGLYVSAFSSSYVSAYPANDRKNRGPICTIYDPYGDVNDIAVDPAGNLVIPNANPFEILVYKGTKLCGPWAATIADPYGQPTGAATNDALNGKIAVANIADVHSVNGGAGSISICTIKAGCTRNLGNPALQLVGGVAMDPRGNCWASGVTSSYASALVYFAGCKGAGVAATGLGATQGLAGIDIDDQGNLVVVAIPMSLYVFKGCKPRCRRVGGPFALEGDSTFGHLNAASTAFAAGDYQYGQVDVYDYTPTSVTYSYSFTKGLSPSIGVEGAAYRPRSKE